MTTDQKLDALIGLIAATLVTVWARRILPRLERYRPVGYIHPQTAAAVGWNGVPLHQHPPKQAETGHLPLYRRL